MSYQQDYMRTLQEDIRTQWFKGHAPFSIPYFPASHFPGGSGLAEISRLIWANPENRNYRIDYLMFGGTLLVSGDVGEAVYCWSDEINLKFLASCDYAYFASKVRGLDGHFNPRQWDSKACAIATAEFLEENGGPAEDTEGWKDYIHTADEWIRFVGDHQGTFDDPSTVSQYGFVPNCRCVGQWMGLRMAYEKLNPTTT